MSWFRKCISLNGLSSQVWFDLGRSFRYWYCNKLLPAEAKMCIHENLYSPHSVVISMLLLTFVLGVLVRDGVALVEGWPWRPGGQHVHVARHVDDVVRPPLIYVTAEHHRLSRLVRLLNHLKTTVINWDFRHQKILLILIGGRYSMGYASTGPSAGQYPLTSPSAGWHPSTSP